MTSWTLNIIHNFIRQQHTYQDIFYLDSYNCQSHRLFQFFSHPEELETHHPNYAKLSSMANYLSRDGHDSPGGSSHRPPSAAVAELETASILVRFFHLPKILYSIL